MPGLFEEDALLWVHEHGLAGRDAEELGIKLINAVEKRGVPGVEAIVRVGIAAKPKVVVPSVRRNGTNRVSAIAKHRPKVIGRVGAAWKATRHGHDGDRFVRRASGLLEFLDPLFQSSNVEQCLFGGAETQAKSSNSASSACSASSSLMDTTSSKTSFDVPAVVPRPEPPSVCRSSTVFAVT